MTVNIKIVALRIRTRPLQEINHRGNWERNHAKSSPKRAAIFGNPLIGKEERANFLPSTWVNYFTPKTHYKVITIALLQGSLNNVTSRIVFRLISFLSQVHCSLPFKRVKPDRIMGDMSVV
ncbi:hypothetical protein CEXT_112781 [Caerostris extrusa]|uniref:Uncharacterized protein n=1 Tax=Caerostris extrusa TaxID=172846 RepID=A0AAV4TCJ6_CAEEX|nr:hypothetical protein CEXT_112781 [Caerostris extrusa]